MKYQQVLDFWFGDDPAQPYKNSALWWKKDTDFDAEIKSTFEDALQAAVRGEHDDWLNDPLGRLAMIILLDQFSRNIFRDQAQAFAQDALALTLAEEGITRGDDKPLHPAQRQFFYLPMMHAEVLDHQQRCIDLFTELHADASKDLKEGIANNIDFAKRHYDIIQRFGRFPHRNTILGRDSTAEEKQFLTQPNSSF